MKDQVDAIRLRPLGEVVDLISGQHIPAKDYNAEGRGVPYLTGPSDFGVRHPIVARWTEHPKRFARRGDILVTVKGSGVGSINVVDIDEVAISRQLMAVRTKEAEPRFIELFLSQQGEYFQQRASGAAIPGLSRHDILDLGIPLPPLEEQKRIVAVLDQAFAALDRAGANAEANLADAEELFEQALNAIVLGQGLEDQGISTDDDLFEFVREQEKRRSDKKFRGPRILSHQGWPKLPPHWCWASPEQLCTHIVDCLHSTPKWTDTGELCLRTTNFRASGLDLRERRYVSSETYEKRISRLEPQAGDVLYSREGGILGIACVLPSGVKACLGQRMMQFRLRREQMLPEYFCSVMNSKLILNEVRHHTGGAAAPHLNIGDIRRFPIPVPPLEIQHKLVGSIRCVTSKMQELKSAYGADIEDAAALRQSLLKMAFTGQIT